MSDLAGKHIHVAGGSRGIGAASVRLAARQGARVSFSYLSNRARADALVDELDREGVKVAACACDLAVEGAADAAADAAVAALGPLDGMVVSAGVFEPRPLAEMTADFWDRTMAVNLRGTFLAVRAAARLMRAHGRGGAVVIYTSTAGQRGSAVYSAYATSKGAQILFMRSMALELAADRIRVNCIAPSWTETEMSGAVMDGIGRADILKGCPLGRVGRPEDVAEATTFLLSDRAAFITGTTMTVDGGIDMRG
jgi:NAD(P)-dependent dehydrogenase (short-subunit alcohol dehydrogenase family)